jgi:membrane-bound inhibitor of C-type lysozyme
MNAPHSHGLRIATGVMVWFTVAAAMADTLKVPAIPVDATLTRTYRCEAGQTLKVTYYNHQGGQSFALLRVKDKDLLFVDTLAASGVKYVAGPYTWWTKGDGGDLYDLTAGSDAAPMLAQCTSTPAK